MRDIADAAADAPSAPAPGSAAPGPAAPAPGSAAASALRHRPWLHGFALLLALCVFLLIGIGGTVTSTGAGMAVPDWPTTFDHHMITAPPSVWWYQPDRFWEHFHRLMGTLVGMLTIAVAVWLTFTQRDRPWLVWLGWGLLAMVIVQGLMGGLRVTEASIVLAKLHGVLGQVVLGVTVLIAAATSRPWIAAVTGPRAFARLDEPGKLFGMRYLACLLLLTLMVQLALGAWVRHSGAGLAIPDFPTAYGQVLPPLYNPALDEAQRAWQLEHGDLTRDYSTAQVAIHLAHRAWAVVVVTVTLVLVGWLYAVAPGHRLTTWPARALVVLLGVQVMLGMYVIWSRRHVDVATAHQACGALVLATATWLTIRLHLLRYTGFGPARPAEAVRVDGVGPEGLLEQA